MHNMKIDIEKHTSTFSIASDNPSVFDGASHEKQSWTTRFVDSFRPDPRIQALRDGAARGDDNSQHNNMRAASAAAESPLARKLKGRHLQMIAIGGSIGKFVCYDIYQLI